MLGCFPLAGSLEGLGAVAVCRDLQPYLAFVRDQLFEQYLHARVRLFVQHQRTCSTA